MQTHCKPFGEMWGKTCLNQWIFHIFNRFMRSRRFTTKNRNSLEILIDIKAAAAAAAGMRNYKNLVFIEKPLFFAHFCIHVRKNSSKGPLNFWFFPDVLMCTSNNCCYCCHTELFTHSNVCVCVCVSVRVRVWALCIICIHEFVKWFHCIWIWNHFVYTHSRIDWINIPGCFASDSRCYYLSHNACLIQWHSIKYSASHICTLAGNSLRWKFCRIQTYIKLCVSRLHVYNADVQIHV